MATISSTNSLIRVCMPSLLDIVRTAVASLANRTLPSPSHWKDFSLEPAALLMGRRDPRTKKGKIFKKSYGKCRSRDDQSHRWLRPQPEKEVSIHIPPPPPPQQQGFS